MSEGGNPLVADRVSSTTWDTGLPFVESVDSLGTALESGDWIDAGLSGIGAGLDALSLAVDPLGFLFGSAFSWVIEHFQPLTDLLDKLAGDGDQVAAYAQTWANVSTSLSGHAATLTSDVNSQVAGWAGDAADAYRAEVGRTVNAVHGLARASGSMGQATRVMGQVVAGVRALVRDVIAQIAGHVASWLVEEGLTLGFATPLVVAQVSEAVAETASTLSRFVHALGRTVENLDGLLSRLRSLLADLPTLLRSLGKRAAATIREGASSVARTTGNAAGTATDAVKSGALGVKDRAIALRQWVGDPVDVASGEMFLGEVDVRAEGVLPLLLSRRHISSWGYGRWFGPTWASTLDARLELGAGPGAEVTLATADALVVGFAHPAPGETVVNPYGPVWELTHLDPASSGGVPQEVRRRSGSRGLWRAVEQASGLRWWFAAVPGTPSPLGVTTLPLIGITDAAGAWIVIDHDSTTGAPAEVRHHGGYRIGVTTENGLVTAYHLLSAAPAGDWSGSGQPFLLRTFRYDDQQQCRLVAVGDADGSQHTFSYDPDGRITHWSDRTGFSYGYRYDPTGRVIETDGSDGVLRTTITYDDTPLATGGHAIRLVTDAEGALTRYEIDDRRLVVAVTDPTGARTTYTHDDRYEVVTTTDPLDRRTLVGRDRLGRVVAVHAPDGARTRFDRDDAGRVVRRTDPTGAAWTYTWDHTDRLVSVTDPLGATTLLGSAPAASTPATVTTASGAYITTLVSNPAGLPVTVTDPHGAVTRYGYDALGHLTSVTDPLGAQTSWQVDLEGRPLTRTLPDGTSEAWVYDGEGNLLAHTDPAGNTTRYEIGPFSTTTAITDPTGATTRIYYDAMLRPIEVVDARDLGWTYHYDPAGRLAAETDYDGTTTRYERDVAGQVTARVTAAGTSEQTTTRFTLDLLGRVTAESAAAGTPDETVTRYTYDPVGRLVEAAGEHTVRLDRDLLGRVVAETVDDRTTTHTYDAFGRRATRTLPVREGVSSRWTFDIAGRPASLTTNGRTVGFAYDPAGRLTRRTHHHADAGAAATGLSVEHGYDTAGRLLTQTAVAIASPRNPAPGPFTGEPPDAARVLHAREYTWRPDGYLARLTDTLTGNRDYTLDPAGRITAVTTDTGTTLEQYAYGPAGDITAATWPTSHEPGTPASADSLIAAVVGPRTHHRSRPETAGRVRYSYDRQGRLVRRSVRTLSGGRLTTSYTWDAHGHLATVTTLDGDTWTYTYDPLGRRTTKTRSTTRPAGGAAATTVFVWDGDTLTAEAGPTLVRTWDYHPDSATPVQQTVVTQDGATTVRAVLTDTVGTPTHLADPTTGTITWTRQATTWGLRTRRDPTDTVEYCPLDHPGQYTDVETGTADNHHRTYDPGLAAYLSPDPLGIDPAPNHRAYPPNPYSWADPHGLSRGGTDYGAGVSSGSEVKTVYRFHNANDPTSLSSRLASASMLERASVAVRLWIPGGRAKLAHAHMRGSVKNSPFVSVTDHPEAAAVSPDPWLRTIVTGAPGSPGKRRAPHLSEFAVPVSRLVPPSNELSVSEGEYLFEGEDLVAYLIQTVENPFPPEKPPPYLIYGGIEFSKDDVTKFVQQWAASNRQHDTGASRPE